MYLYLFIGLAIYRGLISWKFYVAAGRKAWEAFIPFYNVWVLLTITKRPKWWILIYYVPVVDNVMAIILTYELLHVFKFREIKYTVFTVLTLGLYLAYLNYQEPLKYHERDDKWIKANLMGGTVNAIFFAIVAATLIRSTTFESYTIPTGSMEQSLLVGDYLFVNKMQYGVRLPITPITIPLIHNVIPFTQYKSYSELIQLPYVRLPKFSDVQRNDPVVFNYPADVGRPIDKKDNYVKRCVAVPGDSLYIDNSILYVNGVESELPDRAKPQFSYFVDFKPGSGPIPAEFKERFDIDLTAGSSRDNLNQEIGDGFPLPNNPNRFVMFIPDMYVDAIRAIPGVTNVEKIVYEVTPENSEDWISSGMIRDIFPNQEHAPYKRIWTRDDFGPIWIPKEGATVELTQENIDFFKTIIERYEGHTLETDGPQFIIDGEVATSYTFAQNYYWMMGDNRHNSADSRYWGYVPEDHIVGKPVFIWMSKDPFGGIRKDRIFTTVNGTGERRSYLLPFLALVLIQQVVVYFRKKKKPAKS